MYKKIVGDKDKINIASDNIKRAVYKIILPAKIFKDCL